MGFFSPERSQRVGGFLTPGRRALVFFCALFLRIYFKQPALRMGFKISEEAALALPIAAHSRLAYALTVGFIASKSPNARSLITVKIAHRAQITSDSRLPRAIETDG